MAGRGEAAKSSAPWYPHLDQSTTHLQMLCELDRSALWYRCVMHVVFGGSVRHFHEHDGVSVCERKVYVNKQEHKTVRIRRILTCPP